jgi:hypothetical protein
MNNKIYVVTCGWYSDFKNVAVFDNKEAAEAFRDSFIANEEVSIQEWKINHNDFQKGLCAFKVLFVATTSDIQKVEQVFNIESFGHRNIEMYYGDLRTYVWARDKEHATKIATERRAQYINNAPV